MSNPTGFKIIFCTSTSNTVFDFDDIYIRKEIFSSGGIWTWGRGASGQLGNNNNANSCNPGKICCNRLDWKCVSASRFSGDHVAAVNIRGSVWAWGGNDAYQLATGVTTSLSQPCNSQANAQLNILARKVSTGGGVTSVISINANSAANGTNSDGGRTVFGCNANQRAGINNANTTITTRVAGDTNVVWDHISHGNGFAVGVGQIADQDSTYHLLVFGDNTAGQLGTGDTTTRNVPTFISCGWYCVSAGNNHSLGVKRDGTLWAWGCNSVGQLGDGTTVDKSSPVQIGTTKNWKYVSAGGNFSIAVTCGDATGFHSQIWAWGLNSTGQLGDNTTTNRSTPVQTADLGSNWRSVSAGDSHVLAVRANGTLWAWGTNTQGELGDNSTVNRSSPVQVGSATKWLSVSAGKCFSVAIRGDCW